MQKPFWVLMSLSWKNSQIQSKILFQNWKSCNIFSPSLLILSPLFKIPIRIFGFWTHPTKKIYYHTIMNFEIHCQKAFATKAVIPSPLKSQIFSLRSAYTNFWHRPLAATPPNPTSIECMLKDLYLSMNLCEFFSNFWEWFLWFLMRQNKSWYVISKM